MESSKCNTEETWIKSTELLIATDGNDLKIRSTYGYIFIEMALQMGALVSNWQPIELIMASVSASSITPFSKVKLHIFSGDCSMLFSDIWISIIIFK